jgi:hypothetical protein
MTGTNDFISFHSIDPTSQVSATGGKYSEGLTPFYEDQLFGKSDSGADVSWDLDQPF